MRLLLSALLLLAAAPALSAAEADVLTPAPDALTAWLLNQVAASPRFTALCALMGLCRLVFKPLLAIAHNYVENTASPDDDKLLARVEHSAPFRALAFALDWFGSVKLTRPEQFSGTTKLFAPLLLAGALASGVGCQSLSEGQRAALVDAAKLAAKVALQLGLGELSERVHELQPYTPRLGLLIETTFAEGERQKEKGQPEALAAQLKAHVAAVIPPAHQAVVLAQLATSARAGDLPSPSVAASGDGGHRPPLQDFRTRLAAALH